MGQKERKDGRVIITSGRSLMALAAAHSLGKRGLDIIGADCIQPTLLGFSKFVRKNESYANFEQKEEKFLNDLEAIIRKYKPEDDRPYVLMPVFKETIVIAKHKERFKDLITIATPDFDAISKVHPKKKLCETAREYDVHIPDTWCINSMEDMEEVKDELDYPVVIKPEDGTGGKGIEILQNEKELRKVYKKNSKDFGPSQLLQQMVKGEDYCMTAMFQDGELKASMAYKNIRRFPIDSGSGVIRETIDESKFVKHAQSILEPLKWNGVVQLDFMWDEDPASEPYLIEINPRFFGGLFQSVQSGIDYPWLNYLLHVSGELPESEKAIHGTKTKIPLAWILAIIDESINFKENYQILAEAGKEALEEMKRNGLKEAFLSFKERMKERKELKKKKKEQLMQVLQDAKLAESEVFTRDDPFVAVGFLYALSFILKYGKLPPEIDL